MYNATEITIIITDWSMIGLVILFILYNILLVQLSPYIKKTLSRLFDIIIKRDKTIGFK